MLEPSDFLRTESEQFIINVSDRIIARSELSWATLFKKIDQCEELWRSWLFSGLTSPYRDLAADVMSGIQTNNAFKDEKTTTFKVFSNYGNQVKLKHLKRHFIFFDWMQSRGYFDEKSINPSNTSRGTQRTRFPKNFAAIETILELSEKEYRDAWTFILLEPETRVSLLENSLEDSLRFDFEYLRGRAKANIQLQQPIEFLNTLFDEALAIEPSSPAKRVRKHSILRFLALSSCNDELFLPASRLAQSSDTIKNTFSGFMKSFAYRHMTGCRLNEINQAMIYLTTAHKGQRQVRLVDFMLWFCAGNYGSSEKFAPEFLKLMQTATAGEKNHIAPYLNAIREFFDIERQEFKNWEHKLRSRHSLAHIESPLDFFTKQSALIKKSMKVQVQNFEKKTGSHFPDKFDEGIHLWTQIIEELIRKLPRRTVNQAYESGKLWIMYLSTLDLESRPKDFSTLDRKNHFLGPKGYFHFLKMNDLEPRQRLQDLHQIMKIWAAELGVDYNLPLKPGIDWKNKKKTYRTKRKAIPELIVQTLIEENSRHCVEGIPYKLYRDWIKERGTGGSVQNINGVQIDAIIPSVPAVIDSILHLGMRSSSARFLDSGQADEYSIEVDTLKEIQNSSNEASPGTRNGFLQRLQVGANEYVASFLMLRNKTTDIHEIPYAPKDLIKRLALIAQLQDEFNPIDTPTRATDDDTMMNNIDHVPLIFPLFRDPSNPSNKPISYEKVSNWWRQLLRKCEPIVHERRKSAIGQECDKIDFFDTSGSPIWDIHSIRVTVVTALLDMGVPPTIVQHLVGHKSPLMTLHYQSIENSKISRSLREALEQRRLAAANAIANAESEDDLERIIQEVLGGVAHIASGQDYKEATSYAFASSKSLKNSPGTFSVFSHGICPGADCAQGGIKKGSYYFGVHRDKACARCRFRITGPAFLGGLELSANSLMFEISESLRKEENLNKELLKRSKSGLPNANLESRVSQELEFRDELWADWAAEYKTILECMSMLERPSSNNLPAIPGDVHIALSEKGRLPMVQTLLDCSDLILGSGLDLPDGVNEIRDSMVYEIALQDGEISNYLVSLPIEAKEEAIKRFARLICRKSEELELDPKEVVTKHRDILNLEYLLYSETSELGGSDYENQ